MLATAKRANTYDETKFDMPRIAQAKTILWFPDRHLPECYTAFVSKVGDRSIDVAIILPEYTTMRIKSGVRHRNDPDGEIIDRSGDGVWDFAEDQDAGMLVTMAKAINNLTATNRELAARVERLEKK